MAAAIATRGGGHRVGVHVCGPDVPGARVSRRSRARLVWPGVVRAVFVAVCVFGMLVIWGVVCAVDCVYNHTVCLAWWCGLWSAACGMLGVSY